MLVELPWKSLLGEAAQLPRDVLGIAAPPDLSSREGGRLTKSLAAFTAERSKLPRESALERLPARCEKVGAVLALLAALGDTSLAGPAAGANLLLFDSAQPSGEALPEMDGAGAAGAAEPARLHAGACTLSRGDLGASDSPVAAERRESPAQAGRDDACGCSGRLADDLVGRGGAPPAAPPLAMLPLVLLPIPFLLLDMASPPLSLFAGFTTLGPALGLRRTPAKCGRYERRGPTLVCGCSRIRQMGRHRQP